MQSFVFTCNLRAVAIYMSNCCSSHCSSDKLPTRVSVNTPWLLYDYCTTVQYEYDDLLWTCCPSTFPLNQTLYK